MVLALPEAMLAWVSSCEVSLQRETDPLWWGADRSPVHEGDAGRGPDAVFGAIGAVGLSLHRIENVGGGSAFEGILVSDFEHRSVAVAKECLSTKRPSRTMSGACLRRMRETT